MAIAVRPPVPFTPEENSDVLLLLDVITQLTTTLDNEAALNSCLRTVTAGTITSINNTITDASDRLDAIINPAVVALP